jgi:hypothetical protein
MMSGFIAATANQMPPHSASHVAPKLAAACFFARLYIKKILKKVLKIKVPY